MHSLLLTHSVAVELVIVVDYYLVGHIHQLPSLDELITVETLDVTFQLFRLRRVKRESPVDELRQLEIALVLHGHLCFGVEVILLRPGVQVIINTDGRTELE